MNYKQVEIHTTDTEIKNLLIALLNDIGFEGYEETDDSLKAFISEPAFNGDAIHDIITAQGLTYTVSLFPNQNWNATWESNFQPVIIDGFCTIKAHFHDLAVTTPYVIDITPKMSFGTGHHATTQLMIRQMSFIPFGQKKVLDFGTGTGVLAILASMLGGSSIIAIDNDSWSYENALENVSMNRIHNIEVLQGSIDEMVNHGPFDIILANINRHILLEYMQLMAQLLKEDGILLMSGLLSEDESVITEAAVAAGFVVDAITTQNNWISIKASRKG